MARTTQTDRTFQTAADHAYDVICQNILSGKLPQGAKLSRRDMAKLTGVSIIPVIEALHRLEAGGLVESRPYWGSRVISLTEEVIQDRFALREATECQVVRILATKITKAEEELIGKLAAELDDLQQKKILDEDYWAKHYAFHLSLAEAAGHESLVDALKRINLFNLLQRAEYNSITINSEVPKDNHRRVVDAVLTRDPQRAEDEMRTHIHRSGLVTE